MGVEVGVGAGVSEVLSVGSGWVSITAAAGATSGVMISLRGFLSVSGAVFMAAETVPMTKNPPITQRAILPIFLSICGNHRIMLV